jgi:hypothetical protein
MMERLALCLKCIITTFLDRDVYFHVALSYENILQ